MKLLDLKLIFWKLYCNIILASDSETGILKRVETWSKSLITFTPIAFALQQINLWFINNQQFITGITALIFINMLVGAFTHVKTKKFKWKTLLLKTIEVILIVSSTYLVLELIITQGGVNVITTTFRSALQVSTLLYPGGKILKNIFILTNGKYPPKWIMNKIYAFEESGDLAEFLDKK